MNKLKDCIKISLLMLAALAVLSTGAGADVNNLNFTNKQVPAFNISGFKINDINGNGVWDSGETGLENWNIILFNFANHEEIDNKSTDANGSYKFTNVSNGSYYVTEETKPGFNPTNYTIKAFTVAGQDVNNLNFTNQPVTAPLKSFNISGFKINDANSNRVWDSGEMGIENWNIMISNSTMNATVRTDKNGSYKFTNISNGSYFVEEETRSGWKNTSSTSMLVTITGKDITNLNFTNQNVTGAPNITSFSPSSATVNDVVGATRTFNITVNQIVNVTWLINGTKVSNETGKTASSYTNTSAAKGTWNVTAVAQNANGTDTQKWDWIVTEKPQIPGAPNITGFSPPSPVQDSIGANRTFNITVNQTVNVTWLINGKQVQTNNSVTSANYTNRSAAAGTWTVNATVTNANGTDSQEWTWQVMTADITSFNAGNGTRAGSIAANVTIKNLDNKPHWFAVVVGGTDPVKGYPLAGTGVVNLSAGQSVRVPVLVTVPAAAETGNYSLFAGIYPFDDETLVPTRLIGSLEGPRTARVS